MEFYEVTGNDPEVLQNMSIVEVELASNKIQTHSPLVHFSLGPGEKINGRINFETVEPGKVWSTEAKVGPIVRRFEEAVKVSVYEYLENGDEVLRGEAYAKKAIHELWISEIKGAFNFGRVQRLASESKPTEVLVALTLNEITSYMKYDVSKDEFTSLEYLGLADYSNYAHEASQIYPVFIAISEKRQAPLDMYGTVGELTIYINGEQVYRRNEDTNMHFPSEFDAQKREDFLIGAGLGSFKAYCKRKGVDPAYVCSEAYKHYFKHNPTLQSGDPDYDAEVNKEEIIAWMDLTEKNLVNKNVLLCKEIVDCYKYGLNIAVIDVQMGENIHQDIALYKDSGEMYTLIDGNEDLVKKVTDAVPAYGFVRYNSNGDCLCWAVVNGKGTVFLGECNEVEYTKVIEKSIAAGFVAASLEHYDVRDKEIISAAESMAATITPRVGSIGALAANNCTIYFGNTPDKAPVIRPEGQSIVMGSMELYKESE